MLLPTCWWAHMTSRSSVMTQSSGYGATLSKPCSGLMWYSWRRTTSDLRWVVWLLRGWSPCGNLPFTLPLSLTLSLSHSLTSLLIGTHDFTQLSNDPVERLRRNPVRTLQRFDVQLAPDHIRLMCVMWLLHVRY